MSALANADLSCNVVAARFYEHLFVRSDQAGRAAALLDQQRQSNLIAEITGQPTERLAGA